jgi:hypothetical protein
MEFQRIHFLLCFAPHPVLVEEPQAGPKQASPANFSTQKEVCRDIKRRSNGEILINSLNPKFTSLERTPKMDRPAIEKNLSRIRNDSATEHFDQGTFASTIIPHDREYFASAHFQVSIVERGDVPVPLGNPTGFQNDCSQRRESGLLRNLSIHRCLFLEI